LAFFAGNFNGYILLLLRISPILLGTATILFALCTVILSSTQNEGSR
jgi:hypothetical protein